MHDNGTKTIDSALKSLACDGELTIRINGVCMQPLISDGARVLVCKQNFYWPGDILVKRDHKGQLIAHRLIGFFPRNGTLYFVSRADNVQEADAPIVGSQIIGRICGGECDGAVVSVPVRNRVKAVRQFSLLVVNRLGYRISKIAGNASN